MSFSIFAVVAQAYLLMFQVLVLQLDVILMMFSMIVTLIEAAFALFTGVFINHSQGLGVGPIIICAVLFLVILGLMVGVAIYQFLY